jgi:hypothetical protein
MQFKYAGFKSAGTRNYPTNIFVCCTPIYLSDIPRPAFDVNKFIQLPWESAFRKSRWFTRGWTLQELLAPGSVEFFSENWEQRGDIKSLERHIHEIIGIPVKALQEALCLVSVPQSDSCGQKNVTLHVKRQGVLASRHFLHPNACSL